MTCASGQHRNIAGLHDHLVSVLSTQHQPRGTAGEPEHLMRGRVIVMEVVYSVSPLRRPAIACKQLLEARGRIRTPRVLDAAACAEAVGRGTDSRTRTTVTPAQKLTLARRGSGRIVGALLADGQAGVISAILESPFLNEGQVLKVLSRIIVPSHVIAAIADNGRWSQHSSVRLALLRNPQTPLARVLSFLPDMSTMDLRALPRFSMVPPGVRPHIRRELANRMQHGTTPGEGECPHEGDTTD